MYRVNFGQGQVTRSFRAYGEAVGELELQQANGAPGAFLELLDVEAGSWFPYRYRVSSAYQRRGGC